MVEALLSAEVKAVGKVFPLGSHVHIQSRVMNPNGEIHYRVQFQNPSATSVFVFDVPEAIIETDKIALIKWKMGYR